MSGMDVLFGLDLDKIPKVFDFFFFVVVESLTTSPEVTTEVVSLTLSPLWVFDFFPAENNFLPLLKNDFFCLTTTATTSSLIWMQFV